jgi:uncharacterized membrane protein YebE (DUF533 family)
MNPFDILGSLVGGMRPSAGRLDQTFDNQGYGGAGGMFGGAPGGTPQAGPSGGMGGLFDILGKMAGGALGGGAPSGQSAGGSPFDILNQIGGSIFGSGGSPLGRGAGPSAAGAGAMSVFGGLAAQALEYAKRIMSEGAAQPTRGLAPSDIDDATAVFAGLRKPGNAHEERQVLDVATLTIRAMINAAKADGRIDEQESRRLLGKMQEDGVTEEERNFVVQEIRKPMETDEIVRDVPNPQVAAQIYTASLMAIQVDTDAERRYLQELASKLGLKQPVVAYLHQAVGLA